MARYQMEPGLREWIEKTAAEAAADPQEIGGNKVLQARAIEGLRQGNPSQAQVLQALGLLQKWAVAIEYSLQLRRDELETQGYGPDAMYQAMREWMDFEQEPTPPLPQID